jgi:hypothetical protein
MINLNRPIDDLPQCSTALFVYLRKIKARTLGDAYRAAGDAGTPTYLKDELFAIFGIDEFDPKLLRRFEERVRGMPVTTPRETVKEEHVRNVRFDSLKLGKEIRASLKVLWIDALGDFLDTPATEFQDHEFPAEYLTVVNEILKEHGLPEKKIDGLKKKFG